MENKKSQGLSVNVIIIAALALAVMIVLIIIFTGSIKKTSENIGSCITKGGKCADKEGKCPEGYSIPLIVSGDCNDAKPKNLCCLKTGG